MLRCIFTTWDCCRQNHSTLNSLNLIFVGLTGNDFKGLHLHSLESLPIISFYTTLAQLDSHYSHTTWFQGSTPVQPKIFAYNIIVHCTHTTWLTLHLYNLISKFYVWPTWNLCLLFHCTLHSLNLSFTTLISGLCICATWNPYLYGQMTHSRYTHTPWFLLHLQNMISVAFSFLLYVYVSLHMNILDLYLCLN